MKKLFLIVASLFSTFANFADDSVPDAARIDCRDGVCVFVDDEKIAKNQNRENSTRENSTREKLNRENFAKEKFAMEKFAKNVRIAHGWMGADEFLAFLKNEQKQNNPFAKKSWWMILLLALVSGFAMNLTPCVLPMIPVTILIVGRSVRRGFLYALALALTYGALGVLVALGGRAFGEIQGSPWFNTSVALIFAILSFALFGFFHIDFSHHRRGFSVAKNSRILNAILPLAMGAMHALLAGACVAPMLFAILMLTADLFAKGYFFAMACPFVFGLGMALPWPFLGAGLRVLPRPGAWMTRVNKIFAIFIFACAVWYGNLAVRGFAKNLRTENSRAEKFAKNENAQTIFATPATFNLAHYARPLLIDCWASWCKNCTAMEQTTLQEARVKSELARWTVVKVQAEEIQELREIPLFKNVKGLPAFLIIEE